MDRRVVVAAMVATLSACGEPLSPPALAMRFEVTHESLDAIASALRAYALSNRYKFEEGEFGIDRFFDLRNDSVHIAVGAGGWNDAALIGHDWPFEYQVHFYPRHPTTRVDAQASEIGALLSSIDGVRKSGPNFVPDIREGALDEKQFTAWVKQAAKLPGETM